MTPWKYTDASLRVVFRILDAGAVESCLATQLAPEVVPLAPDPPLPPTADEVNEATVLLYAKLRALANMSDAEIDAWVAANVTNLVQAQDAIKTLAKGQSILLRRAFGPRIRSI